MYLEMHPNKTNIYNKLIGSTDGGAERLGPELSLHWILGTGTMAGWQ